MNKTAFSRRAGLAPSVVFLAAAALASTLSHAPAQDAGGYKAKNRSTFAGTQVARDPFWPIGWKKEAKGTETQGEVEITGDEFVVTSILLSPPALAVINGKEYGEGQFIPVPGTAAKAQVAAIQDGVVALIYRGKIITAPLRRNEHLSTPKQPDPAADMNAAPAEAAVTTR